ncbi:uncharacterized protein LOC143428969 [Xylocopa sonorina]|uniref:uncharacterized protein LOC143428969 n=1 Tax=Xylocopa sonorina TaxID=1818115 RepID=UPI00403AFF44
MNNDTSLRKSVVHFSVSYSTSIHWPPIRIQPGGVAVYGNGKSEGKFCREKTVPPQVCRNNCLSSDSKTAKKRSEGEANFVPVLAAGSEARNNSEQRLLSLPSTKSASC